jgi:hypothetical protein
MTARYSPRLLSISGNLRNHETPALLCGGSNVDITQNKALLDSMKERFNPDCVRERSTTLGSTSLGLAFARNLSTETVPFLFYYPYNGPVLSRLHNKLCPQYNTRNPTFVQCLLRKRGTTSKFAAVSTTELTSSFVVTFPGFSKPVRGQY